MNTIRRGEPRKSGAAGLFGFTLIELLVTASTIGSLIALLVRAMQGSREAARKSRCATNPKRVGLALHNYGGVNRSFPLSCRSPRLDPSLGHPWYVDGRPYSALTRLLPFLDQQPLFASINFEVETFPNDTQSGFPFPRNLTTCGTILAEFLCPSDGAVIPHGGNYRGNYGAGPFVSTTQETHDRGNVFSSFVDALRPQSLADGLSRAAAYGERLHGADEGRGLSPVRDFGNIAFGANCTNRDADYALACCQLASTQGFPAYRRFGFTWFYGDFECITYNHAQPPNGRIPDAITRSRWVGIATARSLHAGGVNSLMADGSVRFVRESTVRGVWSGLGTLNGDEFVERSR